jgi:hypothetical protein
MDIMTDNTMTKWKKTYNDLQSLHRQLRIEEQELLNKLEVFWKGKQFLFNMLVLFGIFDLVGFCSYKWWQ